MEIWVDDLEMIILKRIMDFLRKSVRDQKLDLLDPREAVIWTERDFKVMKGILEKFVIYSQLHDMENKLSMKKDWDE